MNVIDKFLVRYSKEYDFYTELARLSAEIIEAELESNGIRAIVTYRAKKPDRLKQKLIQRNDEKQYRRVDQIYADIVDLSGVRIALYFPGDISEVEVIINTKFALVKTKEFPDKDKVSKDKRFSGYWAKHYRCTLPIDNLIGSNSRYCDTVIEIQVASVLMHAWSEVEHDLVYKPLSGGVSEDELAILDQLNGLVMAGEIALERLQKALHQRNITSEKPFNNHYDLAGYLYGQFDVEKEEDRIVLGRVDMLFAFLQKLEMLTANNLEQYMALEYRDNESKSIVSQIVDYIIDEDIELYSLYEEVRSEFEFKGSIYDKKAKKTADETIGDFLAKWITIEQKLKEIYYNANPQDSKHFMSVSRMANFLMMKYPQYSYCLGEIKYLVRLRNELVHGVERPDNESLSKASKSMEELLKYLSQI